MLSDLLNAGVTQLVECNLAKVDVASSSLVTRSIRDEPRAKREIDKRDENAVRTPCALARPSREA